MRIYSIVNNCYECVMCVVDAGRKIANATILWVPCDHLLMTRLVGWFLTSHLMQSINAGLRKVDVNGRKRKRWQMTGGSVIAVKTEAIGSLGCANGCE